MIDDQRLKRAIDRLVAALNPRLIYLFGSRARGDHTADSDYDLLVVTDEALSYEEVYEPVFGTGARCDVVPCTPEELWDARHNAGGVLRDVLHEGVLLYADFASMRSGEPQQDEGKAEN